MVTRRRNVFCPPVEQQPPFVFTLWGQHSPYFFTTQVVLGSATSSFTEVYHICSTATVCTEQDLKEQTFPKLFISACLCLSGWHYLSHAHHLLTAHGILEPKWQHGQHNFQSFIFSRKIIIIIHLAHIHYSTKSFFLYISQLVRKLGFKHRPVMVLAFLELRGLRALLRALLDSAGAGPPTLCSVT